MRKVCTNRWTVRVSAAMIVAVSAAMFAACSSSSSSVPSTHPTSAQPTPTGATPVVPVGWQTCTNDAYGYRISYPSGWYTTDHVTKPGGVTQQRSSYSCTRFDPKPFTFSWGTTPPATELAVKVEMVQTGPGYYPKGTMQYMDVIHMSSHRSLVIFTLLPPDSTTDYAQAKSIVDQAAASLALTG